MSFEGAANACKFSLATLLRMRRAQPDLDAELMQAASEYESRLIAQHLDAMDAGDAGMAESARKALAQRFPQRHSTDAKIRRSPAAAGDGMIEDLDDPATQTASDTSGADIRKIVDKLLAQED
jgi:hypothetical protein